MRPIRARQLHLAGGHLGFLVLGLGEVVGDELEGVVGVFGVARPLELLRNVNGERHENLHVPAGIEQGLQSREHFLGVARLKRQHLVHVVIEQLHAPYRGELGIGRFRQVLRRLVEQLGRVFVEIVIHHQRGGLKTGE